MLRFRRVNKLCSIPFCTETVLVATNHSIKHPLRCIESLKQEHIRIASTMQSFEKLIDKMQFESNFTNFISNQYWNDLDAFLQFCRIYNYHHCNKEEIMFKLRENIESTLLDEMYTDHKYGYDLCQLMATTWDHILDENVQKATEKFIHGLYKHIFKEENVVFNKIIINSTEQQLEDLSQQFEKIDNKYSQIITNMELLSDNLIKTYQ